LPPAPVRFFIAPIHPSLFPLTPGENRLHHKFQLKQFPVKPFGKDKGKSRRQLRVEEQVKRILGDMLGAGASDPRIGFVSILRVESAGDLKSARVYVSVLGEEEEVRRTLNGLESARSYFQRELGARMSSRYTPVITFELDPAIEIDARIDRLLEKAREGDETDEGTPASDRPPA